MTDKEYRAYFFANMYLPGIHAGVQSQHTTAEMFAKYAKPNTIFFNEDDAITRNILFEWAMEDKTTIVLNGGMQGHLQELLELFNSSKNIYPWAYFTETEFALNGALTNVGIVLPYEIYAYDKIVREKEELTDYDDENIVIPTLTDFEMKIVEALRGKRLMS